MLRPIDPDILTAADSAARLGISPQALNELAQ